jgi:hypothetical protein
LEPDGGGEKAGHYLPGTALSVEKAGAGLVKPQLAIYQQISGSFNVPTELNERFLPT